MRRVIFAGIGCVKLYKNNGNFKDYFAAKVKIGVYVGSTLCGFLYYKCKRNTLSVCCRFTSLQSKRILIELSTLLSRKYGVLNYKTHADQASGRN